MTGVRLRKKELTSFCELYLERCYATILCVYFWIFFRMQIEWPTETVFFYMVCVSNKFKLLKTIMGQTDNSIEFKMFTLSRNTIRSDENRFIFFSNIWGWCNERCTLKRNLLNGKFNNKETSSELRSRCIICSDFYFFHFSFYNHWKSHAHNHPLCVSLFSLT